MAVSSDIAREHVLMDGDFDLLISDVRGKDKDPPAAIQFVQEVRELEETRRRKGNYEHVPLIPVVFYSGHDWKAFYAPIQELRSKESCVVWTSGVAQFVEVVLRLLYHIRVARLSPFSAMKKPFRIKPSVSRRCFFRHHGIDPNVQNSSAHSIANRLYLQPQPLKWEIRMEEIQR